jgi:murein DD-endopeptidase MepM/ murein hydrolase activator NlpD
MSTIYEILRSHKGRPYKDSQIEDYSFLHKKPKIDKPAGALAGLSRIHGDVDPKVQDRIIDLLIEISARYKLPFRDIAHLLLICKIESGFNPDAAAGTTSAAGLGQYTKATVEEAAKSNISKKRLGFTLDLSDDYVLDAERGAYGVVLSYMIAKERSIKYFGKDYEKNLYLFHHEGWYFNPTDAHMKKAATKEVLGIVDSKILPYLDPLEKLLSKKTDVSFKLFTKDDKPYPDQPYLAIFPNMVGQVNKPAAVQGVAHKDVDFVFGKTDGQGKTKPVRTVGLSEVLFVILNKDYKDLLDVNSNKDTNTHVVEKNETLSKIAKENGTTVEELQKINHIANASQLKIGQKLVLHDAEYLWRRPPMDLISSFLQKALNMNASAAPAMVEHKRSHIVLPDGNAAQKHGGDEKVVAIRGGSTGTQVIDRKKEKDVAHKTVEADIKKEVKKTPAVAGTSLKDGLLFPLSIRPTESYHTGARRFNSSRGNRTHAGCDLYGPIGTDVRAVADGVILQCYAFYWGTDVVEVDHGDFIVRYGEVAPRSPREQKKLKGMEIKRGDVIGKIGQLIQPNGKKYKDTMLHFELYSSNLSPLSLNNGLTDKKRKPYQRRADLVDPTATLDKCVMT